MPDWEIVIRMWVKDEEEESIAEMAQDIAQGMEETICLEKKFEEVADSETCGVLNASYHRAFYHKEGIYGKNSDE